MKITKDQGVNITWIGLVVSAIFGFLYYNIISGDYFFGDLKDYEKFIEIGLGIGIATAVIGAILGSENLVGRIIGFTILGGCILGILMTS